MTGEIRLPPSLLTAEALIAWRGKNAGAAPEAVILTHQESLFRALAPRFRARRRPGVFPQLCFLAGSGDRLAVGGRIGIGGPATAMAVEDLAAIGVRRIVSLDIAASINPTYRESDVVLAGDAVAADGTSRHYLADNREVTAGSPALLSLIEAAFLKGDEPGPFEARHARIASTDAPFRETAALLDGFKANDAVAIDMETAAFYASATAVGIEAAAVLVIGDSLADVWTPPTEPAAIAAMLLRLAGIVRKALLQ